MEKDKEIGLDFIRWYAEKYGAEPDLGQRIFIDWGNGERLIEKYLKRTKIVMQFLRIWKHPSKRLNLLIKYRL